MRPWGWIPIYASPLGVNRDIGRQYDQYKWYYPAVIAQAHDHLSKANYFDGCERRPRGQALALGAREQMLQWLAETWNRSMYVSVAFSGCDTRFRDENACRSLLR